MKTLHSRRHVQINRFIAAGRNLGVPLAIRRDRHGNLARSNTVNRCAVHRSKFMKVIDFLGVAWAHMAFGIDFEPLIGSASAEVVNAPVLTLAP